MRARVLATQDLYLHIAAGRWILTNRQIPDSDVFSSSMAGAPWLPHEWLASVGIAWIYDHAGWGAIVVASAVIVALAVGALAFEIAPRLGPIGAICAALLAWGLCVDHLLARPHLLALPLAVVWIAAHVNARRGDRAPPLYLTPLMTIWANLHGSFLFGLAFTGLFLAEAIFESASFEQAVVAGKRWSVFLCISLLAALLTPHGLAGLLFPLRLITMGSALDGVQEWQASSLANNAPLIVWCLLLLFVALWHGVRLPLCRLLMVLLLLYLAFAHTRYSEFLGLLTPLLLADAIADILAHSAPSSLSGWSGLARPAVRWLTSGVALFAIGVFAAAAYRDPERKLDRFTPAAALAAVEMRGISGPMINSYNFGGYLIFRGYAPFIDGRVDMYGNAFVSKYFSLEQLPALLEQYGATWTIFEPGNPRRVIMDNLPNWSRLYADEVAVVHVRKTASR